MSKILCLLVLVFALLATSLSGTVYAQEDKDIPILFVNTIGHWVRATGSPLPEVLLMPIGYTNITTVTTSDDFLKEWENRDKYSMLISAYHSFGKDPQLVKWLQDEVANLEKWVKSGGMLITTAGRDPTQEKALSDLFGLKVSNPGTGNEEIVPVEPGTPFAKGIANNEMDSSESSDNNPLNGEIYDEPLPNWVEYVVTRNAAVRSLASQGIMGKEFCGLALDLK